MYFVYFSTGSNISLSVVAACCSGSLVGLDQQSCSTLGPVTKLMGDFLWTSNLPWCVKSSL